ncbi:MAG: HNH endonuclease signature motif containing protein [Anaerolineae bacterium]
MRPYMATFSNHWGEDWLFEYDEATHTGMLKGCDVDWQESPVIEGTAIGLVLDADETAWLRDAWHEARDGAPPAPYFGADTEFRTTKKHGYLTNDYCPLCLKQRDEFQVHHVVARNEGGLDRLQNLLRVCCSCHALITMGNWQERVPRDMAALYHQTMHYGSDAWVRKKLDYEDSLSEDLLPAARFLDRALDHLMAMDSGMRDEADGLLRAYARTQYIYHLRVISDHKLCVEHYRAQRQHRLELHERFGPLP